MRLRTANNQCHSIHEMDRLTRESADLLSPCTQARTSNKASASHALLESPRYSVPYKRPNIDQNPWTTWNRFEPDQALCNLGRRAVRIEFRLVRALQEPDMRQLVSGAPRNGDREPVSRWQRTICCSRQGCTVHIYHDIVQEDLHMYVLHKLQANTDRLRLLAAQKES